MTYTDPSHAHASIMQAIRRPISEILGTRAAKKAKPKSEPHVRAAATRRARFLAERDARLAELRGVG